VDASTRKEQDASQLRLFVAPVAGSVFVQVIFGTVFYLLDQPSLAYLHAAVALVQCGNIALIVRGIRYPGVYLGLGVATLHVAAMLVILGLESGFGYIGIMLLASLPVNFHGDARRTMATSLVFTCLLSLGLLATFLADPIIVLPDSQLWWLQAGNFGGILFSAAPSVVSLLALERRKAEELARLRAVARELGQYTLGEKLGEGGMGRVYRATHALLRRPAAIKLVREGEVGAQALARFEREVQLTSELTHPNTIAIFDYGHTPEGVFYYVMEHLDGLDLQTLVTSYGPQSPQRVVHLLRQICAALHEAHMRGLVHRDIKPANLVLCSLGGTPDVVKVLDFGLVRDLESDDKTAAGVLAGTPAYLSPEAIKDPDEIGPASDLYAVGAVGYFLLTGENVFEGKTLAAVCAAHLHERPVRPSERLGAPVPEVLEELIMDCLEKDPGDRPASARALRLALSMVELERAWDEDEALAWWDRYEAEAAERPAPVQASDLSMTVDVRARAHDEG